MSKNKTSGNNIAVNKKARHDFFIEDKYEAGIVLQGWEVKSLRDGRVQLKESYILLRNSEAFLFNAHITALKTASTHIIPEPIRTRKLLLHRRQINTLIGASEREGYTIVPLALYWKDNKVKVEIAMARGKKEHDKRATIKERDWNKQKERIMKVK